MQCHNIQSLLYNVYKCIFNKNVVTYLQKRRERLLLIAGIEHHAGRNSMKKVETVEKNSLPTKEDIEAEKRLSEPAK